MGLGSGNAWRKTSRNHFHGFAHEPHDALVCYALLKKLSQVRVADRGDEMTTFEAQYMASYTHIPKLCGSVSLHHIGLFLLCRQAFSRWARLAACPQGHSGKFQLSLPFAPGFSWRHLAVVVEGHVQGQGED